MGIITEFLYKVYPEPETLPVLAYISIEDSNDLKNIENAMKDTQFQMVIYIPYVFKSRSLMVCLIYYNWKQKFLFSFFKFLFDRHQTQGPLQ